MVGGAACTLSRGEATRVEEVEEMQEEAMEEEEGATQGVSAGGWL